MVPGGQRRRVREALNVVARRAAIRTEIDRAGHSVVLVVATNEKCLLISQVEVEPSDVSVQLGRRASIETKTTRVQAVADRAVVYRITLRRGREKRKRVRVNTGVGADAGCNVAWISAASGS